MSLRNRSRLARVLVWRLARRWRPLHAYRWPVLVSVWVHLAVVGLDLALPDAPPAPPRAPAPFEVSRAAALPPASLPPVVAHAPAPPLASFEVPGQGPSTPPPPPLEPEPERVSDPEDWLRFARTERSDDPLAPRHPVAISAHDQRTDRPRRAPVTSDDLGPLQPRDEGAHSSPGAPAGEDRDGADEPMLGNRSDAELALVPIGGGAGGRGGRTLGQGSRTAGGDRTAGGPTGRASAPGLTATAAPAGPGQPTSAAPPPAPTGTRQTGQASPWRPSVSRVVTRQLARPTIAGSGGAASPVAIHHPVAQRPTVQVGVERGGTDRDARDLEGLPGELPRSEGRHHVAAPGTADPAEELREALGFGPIDRSRLGPRPDWAGRIGTDGQPDSSPQSPFADVPIDWTTALDTQGTALGEWVQHAEESIVARWRSQDLGTHDRAVGIAGEVTIRYVVRRSGRVTDTWVERSSGNALLDRMALEAVPERLPRLPRAQPDPLHHRITLRYRNPLLSTAGSPP